MPCAIFFSRLLLRFYVFFSGFVLLKETQNQFYPGSSPGIGAIISTSGKVRAS
jgi:hypothetical protein